MHKHFHPDGKTPSEATSNAQARQRAELPFSDTRDFDEARKGFLVAPEYRQIMAEAGHIAWDIGRYDFLLAGEDFDSIHPSLHRQALLNMEYGLFEVVPGRIYQVRGLDLGNISFVKSDNGWIIVDPLTNKATAAAALSVAMADFEQEPLGDSAGG